MDIHLKIEAIPKSLNKKLRTHYHAANKEMKEWRNLIRIVSASKLPPEPFSKANLTIIRHYYRTLDFDGLVGSMKPVVDGLIHAGIITDDSWKVLGQWNVTQQFRPKKDGPLLEIIIRGE